MTRPDLRVVPGEVVPLARSRARHPSSSRTPAELTVDEVFERLAHAGVRDVRVRFRGGRLWTASGLVGGRRRVEEGSSPHTCLRRLVAAAEAVSADPGGAS